MEEIIKYSEIPLRSRNLNKAKPVRVRLSKYQAWLFKKKLEMMCDALVNRSMLGKLVDTGQFLFVLILIFLTSPKISFLSDYYDFDVTVRDRIEFGGFEGDVLVTINPSPAQKTGAPPS